MDLDPRLHFVTATAIIEKDGKFLITKRAPNEKAFPNKWTVPGGKLVRKEVREEVGLEIGDIHYLTDLVFIRSDGYPVVTISYWANYKSGEVVLNHEMTEFAWVTAEEAKKYDLIEGIAEEITDVDKIVKKQER